MLSILYVEDDMAVAEAILEAARELYPQIDFIHARSYAEATAPLNRVGAILSDCCYAGSADKTPNSKGPGGFELLRFIQQIEDKYGRGIPFIYTTANGSIREEMQQYGLRPLPENHIFIKPLTTEGIKKAIDLLIAEYCLAGRPQTAAASGRRCSME